MTKEERHLWYDFLRRYPFRFTRQKVMGKYILDFYCAQAKLAIELDGSQHYQDAEVVKDEERTNYLAGYAIQVVRIPNNEVANNFRGVCEYIDETVRQSLQPPFAQGRLIWFVRIKKQKSPRQRLLPRAFLIVSYRSSAELSTLPMMPAEELLVVSAGAFFWLISVP